jgi:hypothetical protein
MAEQPLPAFFCPISCDIMRDPVSSADGHTYERALIEHWIRHHDTSPKTGAVLRDKKLSPNLALRQAIQEWEEQHGMHVKRASIELEEPPVASGTFKTVYKGWLTTSDKKVKVAVMKLRNGSCVRSMRSMRKQGILNSSSSERVGVPA